MTWHECNEFCTKFSDLLKGRVAVRLPSEAEWGIVPAGPEPAAEFHFGNAINTDMANYDGNYYVQRLSKGEISKKRPRMSDHSQRTRGGWHDVHGNVWEWCRDGKRIYTEADHNLDPDGSIK